jgi:hypothetical protein
MLKLYSSAADDPADPEKNEAGGRGKLAGKKNSFEGKEYSRLSTNDKVTVS